MFWTHYCMIIFKITNSGCLQHTVLILLTIILREPPQGQIARPPYRAANGKYFKLFSLQACGSALVGGRAAGRGTA